MKKFAIILSVINALTLFYLIFTARIELPHWQEPFEKIRERIAEFKPATSEQELWIMLLKSNVGTAEGWSRIVINEYRRGEIPLLVLTMFNIIGFTIMAIKPYTTSVRK